MKTILNARRNRHMARASIFLIMVALIAGAVGCATFKYDLIIASTNGGSVTTPGEGTFTYDEDEVVNLTAKADGGYRFARWTGDVDTIADINAATTTIAMNGDYSIKANFAEIPKYNLNISCTEGGSVVNPGEGASAYYEGTVVDLVAAPNAGYRFVAWTGDVSTIADINDASTTITMDGHYSIEASFEQIPPEEFGYGLVSWWHGEGDATDSGDDNSGVLMNGATFATGKVGQAFQLDGLDDWVMVPSAPNLNFGTEDFTVCLWVNFTDLGPEQIMIEKYVETLGSPERIGWTFTKLTDNIIRLHVGPGPFSVLDAPASITANTWHFAAVCRSGAWYGIYWDGSLIGSISWTDNLNLGSDSSLKIGHRGNPDDTPGSVDERNFYLKGLVDEVQIYSVALSDADILYMFNNPGVPPESVT